MEKLRGRGRAAPSLYIHHPRLLPLHRRCSSDRLCCRGRPPPCRRASKFRFALHCRHHRHRRRRCSSRLGRRLPAFIILVLSVCLAVCLAIVRPIVVPRRHLPCRCSLGRLRIRPRRRSLHQVCSCRRRCRYCPPPLSRLRFPHAVVIVVIIRLLSRDATPSF